MENLERISDPKTRKLFNKMSHSFGSKMNIEYNTVVTRIEKIFDCTLSDGGSNNNIVLNKQLQG